ncbi:hypothetical protein I3271_13550 [Photobacterium leiognathi]|uniref:hypothetical protein n=1 Tax=Photobacterium leiognathi TaxID=553611 RepID=UPI001EDFDF4D|nr:hypothetical protein [Photobacterium leiognathi]MCG3885695.1 hypothetical protein [Photobacterium leiognathi]
MKKFLGVCTGLMLMMPFSLQAEGHATNNPTGPFVECLLPSGNIEFIPAMFCEIKHGKYHY